MTGLCDVLYLFGVGGWAVEEHIIPNQDVKLLSKHKKLGQVTYSPEIGLCDVMFLFGVRGWVVEELVGADLALGNAAEAQDGAQESGLIGDSTVRHCGSVVCHEHLATHKTV